MDFKEKLKKLGNKKQTGPIDWDKNKKDWIELVDKLYTTIEGWFSEYMDEGLMALNESKIKLSEDFMGSYEINKLELSLGEGSGSDNIDEVVVFEPKGRNVIGANGRIDLYLKGRKSEKTLLLLISDDGGELKWELWKSRDKKDKKSFNKEIFEMLISDWLNI